MDTYQEYEDKHKDNIMHIAKQKNQKKRLNLFPLKMFRAGKQENIMGFGCFFNKLFKTYCFTK
jgi:hypothetical protein